MSLRKHSAAGRRISCSQHARWRVLIVLAFSFCLIACTTMQVVNSPPGPQPETVKVGEMIQTTLTDGRILELTVTGVAKEAITGVDKATGHTITVRYSDIRRLAVKRVSWARSLILVGIPVVLFLPVELVLAFQRFGSDK